MDLAVNRLKQIFSLSLYKCDGLVENRRLFPDILIVSFVTQSSSCMVVCYVAKEASKSHQTGTITFTLCSFIVPGRAGYKPN